MTVSARCTACGKDHELADKWDGQVYTCPACGKPFTVRDRAMMPDWSMIIDQAKSSKPAAGETASGTVGGAAGASANSRIAPSIGTVPHAGLTSNGQAVALPGRRVTMHFGMGDDSTAATGLIFLGYGSAIVLQLMGLYNEGVLGRLPLAGWLLLLCIWVALFATIAPITNIGMQLAAKIVGETFGPTLFRMYGLLAIPPAVGFLAMLAYGNYGFLGGTLLGLLLMVPGMWLMFNLGGTNTLIAFLMSALFFVVGVIVYAGVVFVLILAFGLMGLAQHMPGRGEQPRQAFEMSPSQMPSQQQQERRTLFTQERFTNSAPPPRVIEQKQYTLIDSTDAAVKVLGESDPAERRRAMSYLKGLDIAAVAEAARFQVGQALKDRLDDSESDIASNAATMLVAWAPTLAIDTFSQRLADGSADKRGQAMNMLVQMGDKNAIKPIVARLVDDNASASAALIKFGKDAEAEVLAALGNEKPEMRQAAMRVLQSIGTAECLPTIKPLIADTDKVVAGSARVIWKKLDPDSFDPITEGLFLIDSDKPTERQEGLTLIAAAAYDEKQAAGITAKVEVLLSDTDESVAMAAARAAAKYHREDLARDLMGWFDEPTDDALKRTVAMLAVGGMKYEPAAPTLVKWLAMEPQSAAQALIAMGPAAEQPILAVMPARDDAAMTAACNVLEQVGSRKSLILLNSISQTRANAEVRAAAKQARQAIVERIKAESANP